MRSLDEIKDLAQWAIARGAVFVRVDEFEMQVAPDMPRAVKRDATEGPYDPDEDSDPVEQAKRERKAGFSLLTHSG